MPDRHAPDEPIEDPYRPPEARLSGVGERLGIGGWLVVVAVGLLLVALYSTGSSLRLTVEVLSDLSMTDSETLPPGFLAYRRVVFFEWIGYALLALSAWRSLWLLLRAAPHFPREYRWHLRAVVAFVVVEGLLTFWAALVAGGGNVLVVPTRWFLMMPVWHVLVPFVALALLRYMRVSRRVRETFTPVPPRERGAGHAGNG